MPDSFVMCPTIDEPIFEECIRQAKEDPLTERLVIVDDQAFSVAQRKSKALREMVFNGRHYGLNVIIVSQSAIGIGGPAARGNVDYVFLTRENIIFSMEIVYKYFFGVFPTFKDFKKVCEEMKRLPYRCLFCDMSSFGGIRDMVKYYTARCDE
jgi:hypothetical protein